MSTAKFEMKPIPMGFTLYWVREEQKNWELIMSVMTASKCKACKNRPKAVSAEGGKVRIKCTSCGSSTKPFNNIPEALKNWESIHANN